MFLYASNATNEYWAAVRKRLWMKIGSTVVSLLIGAEIRGIGLEKHTYSRGAAAGWTMFCSAVLCNNLQWQGYGMAC